MENMRNIWQTCHTDFLLKIHSWRVKGYNPPHKKKHDANMIFMMILLFSIQQRHDFFRQLGTSWCLHISLEAWKPKDNDVLKPTSLEAAEQIVSQVHGKNGWHKRGFLDDQMRVSSQPETWFQLGFCHVGETFGLRIFWESCWELKLGTAIDFRSCYFSPYNASMKMGFGANFCFLCRLRV